MIAEGSGRIKLDDEVHELQQWDILRIGPGVMRNLEAGSDGITLIAFGAPIGEKNDGEIVPGWWTAEAPLRLGLAALALTASAWGVLQLARPGRSLRARSTTSPSSTA